MRRFRRVKNNVELAGEASLFTGMAVSVLPLSMMSASAGFIIGGAKFPQTDWDQFGQIVGASSLVATVLIIAGLVMWTIGQFGK